MNLDPKRHRENVLNLDPKRHRQFFLNLDPKRQCYSQDIDRRSSLVAKPRKVAKNLLKDKVMKKEQVSIDSSANKYDLTIPVLHILLR